MKLLHIVATPREQSSRTLQISNAFLESLQSRYVDLHVDVLDLFKSDLPSVAGDNIEAKYHLIAGAPIDKSHEESWRQVEALIEQFLGANVYLITTPMWNLSIPYALKYYIDVIMQPGYLFQYNAQGQAEGLAIGKEMICVTSRGGDYSEGSPFHAYDFQEPYLRAIFGFAGITDIHFLNAQPMDMTPELREKALHAAIDAGRKLGKTLDWSPNERAKQTISPKGLKPPAQNE